jgi:glutathione synthase/RimK-type ligase-like ATP-grasp enzyme
MNPHIDMAPAQHDAGPWVAVLGLPDDPPCRLLLEALSRQGTPTLFLDQSQRQRPLTRARLVRGHGLVGTVTVDGREHALSSITGLYLRPSDDRRLWPGDAAATQAALAWTRCWIDIAETLRCAVVNRVSAMASNASKLYQSQLLAAEGFAVPAMLMSNQPDAVRAFEAEQGGVIFKSASGVRSIVQALDGHSRARLDAVRHTPTLFQQQLRGTNVRVHVIGCEVFATEIDSDVVDYRYAGRQGGDTVLRATRLSPEISARCVRATRRLGLDFAGLDLMLCDDGRVHCFEANPSPGYSYYQHDTGQPIADALARHLARHPAEHMAEQSAPNPVAPCVPTPSARRVHRPH